MSDEWTQEGIEALRRISNARDIEAEREAVDRMIAAIDVIRSDLRWYWHWGDGQGAFLLETLAQVVREDGYRWPFDPITQVKPVYRKAVISRRLAKQVMELDKYRCRHCDTHIDLTCDHIIPESKGGETTLMNLQTLCRSCNSKKGARE